MDLIRKNEQSTKLKRIASNSFSKVFQLNFSKNNFFYFKFFLYPKKYIINHVDLSPVFKRDRPAAELFFYTLFYRNKYLKKYLYKNTWIFTDYNLMITKNNRIKEFNLSDAILNKTCYKVWLEPMKKLTNKLIKNQIKLNKPVNFLNNQKVLKLKLKFQVKKPLLSILSSQKVRSVVEKLGSFKYANHGDLQPKNILCLGKKLKIIDFEEGFIGPQGWDIGFLWGNIIYLCIAHKLNFDQVYSAWVDIIKSIKTTQLRSNMIIVTISTILMRIYSFPIIKIKNEQQRILLSKTKKMLEFLEL